jgi:hypothetical protein
LLRRRFLTGDIVSVDVFYGDVLSRRRFVCAPISHLYFTVYSVQAFEEINIFNRF